MKHGLSCYIRRSELEGRSNFSTTIYSFSILCLEHHYCGDQQWRLLTYSSSAFIYVNNNISNQIFRGYTCTYKYPPRK